MECGYDSVDRVEVLTVKSTEEENFKWENLWDIINN